MHVHMGRQGALLLLRLPYLNDLTWTVLKVLQERQQAIVGSVTAILRFAGSGLG